MTELKCKGCLERKVGCHATCESYLTWKKEHEELKEKQRQQATLVRWAVDDAHKHQRRKH